MLTDESSIYIGQEMMLILLSGTFAPIVRRKKGTFLHSCDKGLMPDKEPEEMASMTSTLNSKLIIWTPFPFPYCKIYLVKMKLLF